MRVKDATAVACLLAVGIMIRLVFSAHNTSVVRPQPQSLLSRRAAQSASRLSNDAATVRLNGSDADQCNLPRFHVDDPAAFLAVQSGPVMLFGWEAPSGWDEETFMQKHGDSPQPRPVVQRGTGAAYDIAQSTSNVTTADYLKTAKAMGAHQLLFTYEEFNPQFFNALRSEWRMPGAIAASLRQYGRNSISEQFSASGKLAFHHLHHHREAWLGLAQGRKWWWLLNPDSDAVVGAAHISKDFAWGGQSACSYLRTGPPTVPRPELPRNRWFQCLQRPGEVVWFSDGWWHATCSLDSWTVGIGAQIEDPRGPAAEAPPTMI